MTDQENQPQQKEDGSTVALRAARLLEKITSGVWYVDRPRVAYRIRAHDGSFVMEPNPYGVRTEADADFIAAAPQLVRELLAYLDRAQATITRLEAAIREHRDARGDDRCWIDDETLYQALPEGYTPPAQDEAFELARCEQFIASRRHPATAYVSPQQRIEELEHACAVAQGARDDYREAYEDTKRLAREIDVALHGEDGAAKQASLCDLVGPAEKLRATSAALIAALRELIEKWGEREKSACRRADAQPSTMYAERLAMQATELARCQDELEALLPPRAPEATA